MDNSIQNRMPLFLQKIGLTAEQFERQVGLGGGFVSRINRNVRKASLFKITNCYPNLNIDWLLSGEGEMFKASKDEGDIVGTTQKDRLHSYAVHLNMSDIMFCKKAGLSPSYITKLTNNMRETSAKKIKDAFPQLNMDWVKTGKGNMENICSTVLIDMSIAERIEKLIAFIGISRANFENQVGLSRGYVKYANNVSQITITKICARYPFVSDRWLAWGVGSMIEKTFHSVPLIDLNNTKHLHSLAAKDSEWDGFTFYPCLDSNIDFAFCGITGMNDVSSTDIVLCKRTDKSTENCITIYKDRYTIGTSSNGGIFYKVCEIIKRL